MQEENTIYKIYSSMKGDGEMFSKASNMFFSALLGTGRISPEYADSLEWWEPTNPSAKIAPGQIYVFNYTGKSQLRLKQLSSNKEKAITLAESFPTVLATKAVESEKSGKKYLTGINLNYLTPETRAVLLDTIKSIDKDYFSNKVYSDVKNSKFSYSEGVSKAIYDSSKFFKLLKVVVKQPDLAVRTYCFDNIKGIKHIDIWAWQYIPFLNYDKCLDGVSLKALQEYVSSGRGL